MGMSTVTGWGNDWDGATHVSDVLRMVQNMPIMTNSACKPFHPGIGDGHLCIDTAGRRGPVMETPEVPWSRRRAASRALVRCGLSTGSSPSDRLWAVDTHLLASPGSPTTGTGSSRRPGVNNSPLCCIMNVKEESILK